MPCCSPASSLAVLAPTACLLHELGIPHPYPPFPRAGKLLNVRDAAHKTIEDNKELKHIKQILGLRHGQDYTSAAQLRYGKLMLMTDQDHDGSHIKGLLINLLHHLYPSLLHLDGFLQEFITPIVKVREGATGLIQWQTCQLGPEYCAYCRKCK